MNPSTHGYLRALRGLLALSALAILHTKAHGQLFISHGVVSEYTVSGAVIHASLIADGDEDVALLGSDLYTLDNDGTIGKYTTAGATINASLVSAPSGAYGFAVSGSHIFVANSALGTVEEYTTSGATVTTSLISGLTNLLDIDVKGSDLFVSHNGIVSEYTTSGALVNPTLITGITGTALVVSGSDIYVDNAAGIGEYTTSGATVNASLISVPFIPGDIAVSASDIFVGNGSTGTISEYSLSGATIDSALITGLGLDTGIAVVGSVPEEPWKYAPFLALATLGFAMIRRKRMPA